MPPGPFDNRAVDVAIDPICKGGSRIQILIITLRQFQSIFHQDRHLDRILNGLWSSAGCTICRFDIFGRARAVFEDQPAAMISHGNPRGVLVVRVIDGELADGDIGGWHIESVSTHS